MDCRFRRVGKGMDEEEGKKKKVTLLRRGALGDFELEWESRTRGLLKSQVTDSFWGKEQLVRQVPVSEQVAWATVP